MNKIYKMTNSEFENKKILYQLDDVKCVVIDGSFINTYEQYFDQLWVAFDFSSLPNGWKKDFYTEDEYLTDMDELPFDKYALVIKNYNEFLQNKIEIKQRIENNYKNYILPYWDSEVEQVVVDGKRKDFNVYLIV